jgi:hypothetical protein
LIKFKLSPFVRNAADAMFITWEVSGIGLSQYGDISFAYLVTGVIQISPLQNIYLTLCGNFFDLRKYMHIIKHFSASNDDF